MKKQLINIASGFGFLYATYSAIFNSNAIAHNVVSFAIPALAIVGILGGWFALQSEEIQYTKKQQLRPIMLILDITLICLLSAGQWYVLAGLWLVSTIIIEAKYEKDMELINGDENGRKEI